MNTLLLDSIRRIFSLLKENNDLLPELQNLYGSIALSPLPSTKQENAEDSKLTPYEENLYNNLAYFIL